MPAILTWIVSVGMIKALAVFAAWLGAVIVSYSGLDQGVDLIWREVYGLISGHNLSEFMLFSLRLARIDDVIAVVQVLIAAKLALMPVKTLVIGAATSAVT